MQVVLVDVIHVLSLFDLYDMSNVFIVCTFIKLIFRKKESSYLKVM